MQFIPLAFLNSYMQVINDHMCIFKPVKSTSESLFNAFSFAAPFDSNEHIDEVTSSTVSNRKFQSAVGTPMTSSRCSESSMRVGGVIPGSADHDIRNPVAFTTQAAYFVTNLNLYGTFYIKFKVRHIFRGGCMTVVSQA